MIGTNDPAAWTSASFAGEDDYLVALTPRIARRSLPRFIACAMPAGSTCRSKY